MGPRQEAQSEQFYEFSIERHVPQDHLLRSVDRFVYLSRIRQHLAPFYSSTGRPSIAPELMLRMLLVGYIMSIRSERRVCEAIHVNLAFRWFCRLDLTRPVPDHSTFSKNRHGRFRDSDLLRHLFETVVARCISEGLAADASLIHADANRQNSTPQADWDPTAINPEDAPRAVLEYLATLDDAAFGAAFAAYVEKVLVPELSPGTVVILDNLATHKNAEAEKAMRKAGCWFLFLLPYSPDLNPIEMSFSKLKAHLRRIGARTFTNMFNAISEICDLYSAEECWNYFMAVEYAAG